MTRRGDDARSALIETAERFFAERGIEAVSLRDVSAAAGQRNHSAAQYHFGDREGLVAAVYQARMSIVNARRRQYFDEIDAAGRSHEVTALIEALIVPLVDVVAETNGWYGRFLARSRWDAFAWRVLEDLPAATSYRQVVDRLAEAIGGLPPQVRHSRIEQLLTLGVGTIAGWESALHHGAPRLSPATLAAELVVTGVALIGAPFDPAAADRFADRFIRHTELTGAHS